MIRRTSTESYNKIRNDGLLSRRRFEVYEALLQFGPCTANELFREMKYNNLVGTKNQQTNLTPRLGELRDLGVVIENRERECSVTGRTVIEWMVVDKIPGKLEKTQRQICQHCNGSGYKKD